MTTAAQRRDGPAGPEPEDGSPTDRAEGTAQSDDGERVSPRAPRRRGRRRGRPASSEHGGDGLCTRELILAAARTEFAQRGYDQASIRAIARGAEVDPALVHHYFGNKEQVFAAAIEKAAAPVIASLETVPLSDSELLGERLTRCVFALWENRLTRDPLLAVIRSAVTHDTAARIFRDLLARRLMLRLAREMDVPDRELRVELAVAQLVGTAMLRYVIKAEPLASAPPEQLIARIAPVVQGYLTAT